MANFFDDAEATIANIERWQERKRQVQFTADQVTPGQAVNISRLARMFPFVSPGVIRGLGSAGFGPDDNATQFAIMQEMLRNYSTTGSWSGQLGLQQRETRYGTLTDPDAPARKRDPREFLYQGGGPQSPVKARFLMKKGETLGIFDPDTQTLIQPEISEDGNDSEANKVFYDLKGELERLGGQPIPYLAVNGKFMQDDLTSGLSYEVDMSSGSIVLPEDRPDPRITGAYRNESGVGGSLGQVEDYGRAEQNAASSAIIARIFQDAEDNPEVRATLDSSLDTLQNNEVSGAGLTQLPSITPIARTMFMGMDAPIQEATGQIRNIYGALHGEDVDWLQSQSDLGVAIDRNGIANISKGSGHGLFVDPESAVAIERRRREAELGQIGGHNLTVGRILANSVGMEPDTKPFLIVSGLADGAAQLADPTAFVLGEAANISDARKTFATLDDLQDAGIFARAHRKLYSGPTFEAWANKNTAVFDKMAELDSPYAVARLTNFKLGPDMEAVIARIPDPENVRKFIGASIERSRIQTVTDLKPKRSWRNVHEVLSPTPHPRTLRMFDMMPGQTIDLTDKRQAAEQLRRVMTNAHASEDQVANIYNKVANAKNKNDVRNAVMSAFSGDEGVRGLLQSYGISDEMASVLTRTNVETYAEDLRGHIDEIGADVPTWDVMGVDGIPTVVPGPHLPLEHIGRFMQLPDQAAIRRLTTRFNFLTAAQTDIPLVTPFRRSTITVGGKTIKQGKDIIRNPEKIGEMRLPLAAADWAMSEILKPLWLLRLAWPVRVIGEEQLRMATSGLDAMTKHPMSYIATVVGGEQGRFSRLLDNLGVKGKMTKTPSGAFFDEVEELGKATYRAHGGWLSQPGVIRSRQPVVYNKNNPDELLDWRSSWAHELALYHNDPVSNFIANHNFEDSVQWLTRGPGMKYRDELRSAHPGNLESPEQIRRYVQTVVDDIKRSTAGHPDLLDVVKTGKFSTFKNNKETVSAIFQDVPKINPQFTHHLRGYDEIGPEKIKGRASIRNLEASDFPHRMDAAVDRMMSALMGQPTSKLSRSPAFRQFVWKRAAEILPSATTDARKVILANAKEAGLNARQMRTLERAATRGRKNADGTFAGTLNEADVDLLARGHALDDTKQLLYDLSERSQITDILRILVPFGEAWKEVITRWAKLATISGPGGIPLPGKPVRRFQQVIQGARGADFGKVMGVGEDPVTGKQRGFFYTNEFGEEVYAYPGSEWATAAMTGVPAPLTGRVQGLNMFGTVIPGLGPVAQIPVAWYLQDKPEMDEWREQLLPFGAPGSNQPSDVGDIRSYLPAWAKTGWDIITEGGHDDRIWNSSIMYTASYLYSTGEYGDSVEEQQRLMEDAKDAVHGKMGFDGLFGIRMLGQFMLPSSPTFEWVTKAEDGRLINTRILAEEFYELQQEDYDSAVERFLEVYGPNAIGAIIPHSNAVISAAPTSLEAAKWVAQHPGVKKKFDLVYGFFAPEGEFHMPTYAKNFFTGERDPISPEQWLNLRDTLIGNYHYQRAKDMLGEDRNSPNDEQTKWLREQKANILEAYPNWNNRIGLAEKATDDPDRMIAQLYRAVKDNTVKGTDAGKGLALYLPLRDAAIEKAKELGFASFKTANKMSSTRAWLNDNAQRIIAQHPDFERLWDVVLSRELEE